MEFWPIFDIFHRLRPYLCSKREVLGFHKQATHRRRDDEPFFTLGSTVHDWGWPKNGQTWQACQRSKVVNLSLFEHLGPFWTISNKNWYFAPKHLCKTLYCPFRAKISSPALTLVCDCVGRCSWLWFSEVKLARLATTLAMICQMGNRFLSSPVRWFH